MRTFLKYPLGAMFFLAVCSTSQAAGPIGGPTGGQMPPTNVPHTSTTPTPHVVQNTKPIRIKPIKPAPVVYRNAPSSGANAGCNAGGAPPGGSSVPLGTQGPNQAALCGH